MNSRRSFLKLTIGLTGVALIAPKVLANESRRPKPVGAGDSKVTDLPMVEPGKDMAASVNYVHKSPHKDKHCSNCTLYTKYGTKDGKETGKCSLFAGKVVFGEGYCNSWAAKK